MTLKTNRQGVLTDSAAMTAAAPGEPEAQAGEPEAAETAPAPAPPRAPAAAPPRRTPPPVMGSGGVTVPKAGAGA